MPLHSSFMKADLLRGHLDACCWRYRSRAVHGYAVIEATRAAQRRVIDLPTGTSIPALHRLERGGLIRSSWSAVGAGAGAPTHSPPQDAGRWRRNGPTGERCRDDRRRAREA